MYNYSARRMDLYHTGNEPRCQLIATVSNHELICAELSRLAYTDDNEENPLIIQRAERTDISPPTRIKR
jgi:hypothetical protein